MRVYIDGFNLYFGGKRQAGSTRGWKWLNLRALSEGVAASRWGGKGAVVEKVTLFTAVLNSAADPGAYARQAIYLKALQMHRAVDHIEYGVFIEKTKKRPLAVGMTGGRPNIVRPGPPLLVRDPSGVPLGGCDFLVEVADREEKGSDVNLASHLLIDALSGAMDAAVVISNDSDLALPVREVRQKMSVGTVNPDGQVIAKSLRPPAGPGTGHWFHRLTLTELQAHQLPDPCGPFAKPGTW